ncbi:hypothetical protein BASA81_000509 [Batrachochytrium salamandrivorans]|nr:hypothetical protein BASA81_000509 [Batrachochytrium salamandrivorans]
MEARGDKFASEGDLESAAQAYSAVHSTNSAFLTKRAKTWYELGKIHHSAKRFYDALEDAKFALKCDLKNREALKTCINALFKLEHFDSAHELATAHAALANPELVERTRDELDKFKRTMHSSKMKRAKGTQSLELSERTMNLESRRMLIQRAITEYKDSMHGAVYYTVKSFALRNCGVASAALCKEEPTLANFEHALVYFQQSVDYGKQVQLDEWIEKAVQQQNECLDGLFVQFKEDELRSRKFSTLATRLGKSLVRLRLGATAGSLLFQESLLTRTSTEDAEALKRHLSLLEDALLPLRLAGERVDFPVPNGGGEGFNMYAMMEEAAANLESIEVAKVIAQAQFAIHCGVTALNHATQDFEQFQMHSAFEGLDHFKAAARLASGKDLVSEAEAMSWCATFYNVVLHDFERAKKAARCSLELATSCFPQDFTNKRWYKSVVDIVKREQAKTTRAEESEREPFLAHWKNEIAEIDVKASESWQALMQHVYSKFPPGNAMFEGELKAENGKRALIKAILHFHPDKVEDKTNRSVQILHEEITKRLTAAYEMFKA